MSVKYRSFRFRFIFIFVLIHTSTLHVPTCEQLLCYYSGFHTDPTALSSIATIPTRSRSLAEDVPVYRTAPMQPPNGVISQWKRRFISTR